ncbi:NAD(P)-binding domain-containing protein [Candidatus Woesearchaeota archaeon]|nr:NAD(P)-binding domain-containing protein [Candidatus Woesearchaeota archaeon]
MAKIGIIGVGAFGFAFLKYLDTLKKHELMCYDLNKEIMTHIQKRNCHPHFHNCIKLSKQTKIAKTPTQIIQENEIIIICTNSNAFPQITKTITQNNTKQKIIINISKGLEKTGKTLYTTLKQNKNFKGNYAYLSGGTTANSFLNNQPIAMSIATTNTKTTNKIIKEISSKKLKITKENDILGQEYAAALKNIISLWKGLLAGLGYQKSTQAYLLTELCEEIINYATKKGAKKTTFSTTNHSWMTDIILSTDGETRNYTFGKLVGEQKNIKKTLNTYEKEKKLLEGIQTLKIISKHEKTRKNTIIKTLTNIFIKEKNPHQQILKYLNQPPAQKNT